VRLVECAGAPRDLGFDQGRACASAVSGAVRGRRPGPHAIALHRDLWRHLPHLAERHTGLARGAGVGLRALLPLLEEELVAGPRAAGCGGLCVGVDPERGGGGVRLVRGVTAPAVACLLLRRSRPDPGYRSLEVTQPWLGGALAGVNEAGLAASGVTRPVADPGPVAAPALLLVQDCLQRCDTAEKAVEWCLRRPAGGRASLLFGDRAGRSLGVFVDGAERRVLHPTGGLLLPLDPSPEAAALEKACREALVLDGVAFQRIRTEAPDGLVWLDPERCRLGLLGGPPATAEPDGVRYVTV
jgi:hypothetical protein